MSQREDLQGHPDERPEFDVLTGEDVILDDSDFSDATAVVGDGVSNEAPPAKPPAEATQNIDPAPLATDFPTTSRVDISTAEDLAETTSVLATDFTAPRRDDITEAMQDVLSGRAQQPTVAADGETLVFSDATEVEPAYGAETDLTATSILRRSLINGDKSDKPDTVTEEDGSQTEPSATTATPAVAETAPEQEPEAGFDETLLAGASILPTLPSRAAARWLSAIGTLLLAPLAWYLLTDSAVRLVAAANNPWVSGQPNLAALAELAGGLAVLVVIGILAAQSSLGLFLSGTTVLVTGLPFLVAPGLVSAFLGTYVAEPLGRLGSVGDNLFFHFEFTGASGILVMVGTAMLVAGWLVYRVRRVGRREEALRTEVVLVNPEGLRARWARKASE